MRVTTHRISHLRNVLFSLQGQRFEKDTCHLSHLMTKQQSDCAPSEDSDQPGHPPSLIRVFAFRMKKTWVLNYTLSAQRRLWSDWADVQADLSLRWAHSHFVGFFMSWLILRARATSGLSCYCNLWTQTLVNQIIFRLLFWYEPPHEKTCFCHMRTTKVQISLRSRAVWSAPLLFAG